MRLPFRIGKHKKSFHEIALVAGGTIIGIYIYHVIRNHVRLPFGGYGFADDNLVGCIQGCLSAATNTPAPPTAISAEPFPGGGGEHKHGGGGHHGGGHHGGGGGPGGGGGGPGGGGPGGGHHHMGGGGPGGGGGGGPMFGGGGPGGGGPGGGGGGPMFGGGGPGGGGGGPMFGGGGGGMGDMDDIYSSYLTEGEWDEEG